MIEANPKDAESLQELLQGLQDDFVLYTKPEVENGGRLVYLAL